MKHLNYNEREYMNILLHVIKFIRCVHIPNTQGTSFEEQMAIYALPIGS